MGHWGMLARLTSWVDWFVPPALKQRNSELSLARIFVATHLLGPAFSQSISAYVLAVDPQPNWVVFTLVAGICSFWTLPFVLKYTGSFERPAFFSFVLLTATALFGSFHYGGVTSPFLPWVMIALLLGFFYLSSRPVLVLLSFALTCSLYAVAHLFYGFSDRIPPEDLITLGWISILGAVAYMTWMAYYYSTVVSSRHDAELELLRHKQMAQRLSEAKDIAEAADKSRSIFLTKMSHELRTPLNAVIGYSELLQESFEDANAPVQKTRDLQRISAAGKHLLDLVDQVLDLSKIEKDAIEVKPQDVDLAVLVRDVESTAQSLIGKNNNRLTVQVPAKQPTVVTDVTMIRQILLNLLSNAAKFTSNGQITLLLRFFRVEQEDWMEMVVSDTGIGIAADVLPNLFSAYAQASASTAAQFGGTGIGLSICRKFCIILGGKIDAASTPGEGTSFTVRLPAIYRADAANERAQTDQPDHQELAQAA
jgi:signal transduction histidine kinase